MRDKTLHRLAIITAGLIIAGLGVLVYVIMLAFQGYECETFVELDGTVSIGACHPAE